MRVAPLFSTDSNRLPVRVSVLEIESWPRYVENFIPYRRLCVLLLSCSCRRPLCSLWQVPVDRCSPSTGVNGGVTGEPLEKNDWYAPAIGATTARAPLR